MFFRRNKGKQNVDVPSFMSLEPISVLTDNPPKLTLIIGGSARIKGFIARSIAHGIKGSIVTEDQSKEVSPESLSEFFLPGNLGGTPELIYVYYPGTDWIIDAVLKNISQYGFPNGEITILSLDRLSDRASKSLKSAGIPWFHPVLRNTRDAFYILNPGEIEIIEKNFRSDYKLMEDPENIFLVKFRDDPSDFSEDSIRVSVMNSIVKPSLMEGMMDDSKTRPIVKEISTERLGYVTNGGFDQGFVTVIFEDGELENYVASNAPDFVKLIQNTTKTERSTHELDIVGFIEPVGPRFEDRPDLKLTVSEYIVVHTERIKRALRKFRIDSPEWMFEKTNEAGQR